MNETKHTPGPWIVNTYETNSRTNPRQVTVIAPGMTIRVSGFRQDANANLIAAAPDLLALLEKIDSLMAEWKNLNYINYGKMQSRFDEDLERVELEIEEAIAAAKGEA